MRTRILSVTIADCDVQTFRAGGSGGQNQNKRDTGVRIIHRASGARGEARDERSQWQNKKLAWKRMAASPKFQL
jgi:protein subunit release factor B